MASTTSDNLFKWIKSFPLERSPRSLDDLYDGVVLAHVCHQICPVTFDQDFLSKIKDNLSPDNWRLRVSNIKKVIDGLTDFYDNVIQCPVSICPDSSSIAKDLNRDEMNKLLKLVLGAAVNCDHKQEYISTLMNLDMDIQLLAKNVIEDLFSSDSGRGRSNTESLTQFPDSLNPHRGSGDGEVYNLKMELKRLSEELHAAHESREKSAQEVYDMKRTVSSMKEENVQLSVENENLRFTLKDTESRRSQSREPAPLTPESSDLSLKEMFCNKLNARIESLQEELYKMENSKEEVRIKNELLEKELMDMKFRNEELQRKANEARHLKDELDIHKQLSEKAEKYESTLDLYRRKLEEAAEFKKKHMTCSSAGVMSAADKAAADEETRRMNQLKGTNDNLRKQVTELTTSLATVQHSSDQQQFEVSLLRQKYEAVVEEKELMRKEMNLLMSRNRERAESEVPSESDHPSTSSVHPVPNLNMELGAGDTLMHEENDRLKGRFHDQAVIIQDLESKVQQLEAIISKKDEEASEMETRYRKAVTKAKEVAKVLEPISISSSNSSINSMANMEQLAQELQQRNRTITELETEVEKTKSLKELEDRLMSSAFHRLASRLQRTSAEERMTGKPANQSVNNGSFLSRQRQPTSRKFNVSGVAQK